MMDRDDGVFWSTAAVAAVLAGASGLLYAVAFVLLRNGALAALMLTSGGLLSVIALVAVSRLIRDASAGLATVGLILAAVGAFGAAVHGAYNLANILHPPGVATELPNAVDPRGFLTFGVSGLGVPVLSALAMRTPTLPRSWSWLGVVLGVLLVIVYLGRLVVLDATSPLILAPAGVTGFIVNPAWYIWLAQILRRAS